MLLRLLLALTIAMLPMPAVAACHQPEPMATHHHGMKHEPVKRMAVEQLCMGCVAPASIPAPAFAAPAPLPRADAPAVALTGEKLIGVPPATPPPRPAA